MSIKVDWDEINSINKELDELAVKMDSATQAAGHENIAVKHFATVEGSAEAGAAAEAAKKDIYQGLQTAEQFLQKFVADLKTTVDQHKRNDDSAQATFSKQDKDLNK